MSKLPPGLVYLTIYNPTLRPIDPASLDDDDAGELAQILFYTARDRAVSRDKMLRQIGLAKALVNFSRHVLSLLLRSDGSVDLRDLVYLILAPFARMSIRRLVG